MCAFAWVAGEMERKKKSEGGEKMKKRGRRGYSERKKSKDGGKERENEGDEERRR